MQPTVKNLKDQRVARDERLEALAWLAASLRWVDRLDQLEGHRRREPTRRRDTVAKAG